MPAGRISLAEQIAQLEEAAPVDYDPEDLQSRGAEAHDEMHMDAAGSREHYLEVGLSSLRNRLPSIAHPKYEGVRASRKQLLEDSDNEYDHRAEEDSEGEADANSSKEDEDMNSEESQDKSQRREGNEHRSGDEEAPSESEESEGSAEQESYSNVPPPKQPTADEGHTDDVASTLKKAREEDLKKGQAVKRQMALWDTLLDTRIRMQKSVVSANRLPPPSEMKKYLEASECQDSISKFLNEASLLTNELSELQENLLTINDIVKPPPRKRRKLEPEASIEDYHELFAAATEDAVSLEQVLHPYFLQTLSKWSSKIQAVAPSVLLPSNRGAFLKGGPNLKSVVQLIDENLADREKLLEKTQVARVKKPRIGMPQEENDDAGETPDPEIFDDTDFYQQLLRDIIDARGNGSKNDDWLVLQKQKKAKRKVDTKASKGRKLRYEVHEKFQNFMVPVLSSGAWHEEQVDELFASLLGKGFENIELNGQELQVRESIELTGFRVFG